jgi:predicted dehydrogenase
VKVALLGCGKQGQNHMRALQALAPETAIVTALCDVNPARVNEAAALFPQAATFSDYRAAISTAPPDLVIIATMANSHAEIAMHALREGANVLCEKPFTLSAAEAEQVLQCAAAHDRQVQLGTNMRYMPSAQYLHQLVASGEVGEPLSCRVWGQHHTPPLWTANCDIALTGGGVLASTMIHGLDLAIWVTGSPAPVSVTASAARTFPRKRSSNVSAELAQRYTVEDLLTAFVRFDNGCTFLLEGNWCSELHDSHGFELVTSAATLVNTPFTVMVDRAGAIQDETPADLGSDDWFESIKMQDTQAVERLRDGVPWSMQTPQELYNLQRLVDACYESARSGREVRLV